jgi:hypothetical protein
MAELSCGSPQTLQTDTGLILYNGLQLGLSLLFASCCIIEITLLRQYYIRLTTILKDFNVLIPKYNTYLDAKKDHFIKIHFNISLQFSDFFYFETLDDLSVCLSVRPSVRLQFLCWTLAAF